MTESLEEEKADLSNTWVFLSGFDSSYEYKIEALVAREKSLLFKRQLDNWNKDKIEIWIPATKQQLNLVCCYMYGDVEIDKVPERLKAYLHLDYQAEEIARLKREKEIESYRVHLASDKMVDLIREKLYELFIYDPFLHMTNRLSKMPPTLLSYEISLFIPPQREEDEEEDWSDFRTVANEAIKKQMRTVLEDVILDGNVEYYLFMDSPKDSWVRISLDDDSLERYHRYQTRVHEAALNSITEGISLARSKMLDYLQEWKRVFLQKLESVGLSIDNARWEFRIPYEREYKLCNEDLSDMRIAIESRLAVLLGEEKLGVEDVTTQVDDSRALNYGRYSQEFIEIYTIIHHTENMLNYRNRLYPNIPATKEADPEEAESDNDDEPESPKHSEEGPEEVETDNHEANSLEHSEEKIRESLEDKSDNNCEPDFPESEANAQKVPDTSPPVSPLVTWKQKLIHMARNLCR